MSRKQVVFTDEEFDNAKMEWTSFQHWLMLQGERPMQELVEKLYSDKTVALAAGQCLAIASSVRKMHEDPIAQAVHVIACMEMFARYRLEHPK